jgi:hypothetical protein
MEVSGQFHSLAVWSLSKETLLATWATEPIGNFEGQDVLPHLGIESHIIQTVPWSLYHQSCHGYVWMSEWCENSVVETTILKTSGWSSFLIASVN